MKRNWLKIAIILLILTVVAGAATPLFGDAYTKLFSFPSYINDWKAPEGKIAATIDYAPARKVENKQPYASWEVGSFILIGSGMMIFANWGRRKVRR